jgi:hypothetical protein
LWFGGRLRRAASSDGGTRCDVRNANNATETREPVRITYE